MPNIISEYIVRLAPQLDTQLWNKASDRIDSFIERTQAKFDTYNELVRKRSEAQSSLERLEKQISDKEAQVKQFFDAGDYDSYNTHANFLDKLKQDASDKKDQIANADIEIGKLGRGGKAPVDPKLLKGISGGLKSGIGVLGAATKVVKEVVNVGMKLAEQGKDISNKFVSGNSVFMNTDIRDTMSKYGVSNFQAQGMQFAMSQMGIDESEFGRLNDSQKEFFTELTGMYDDALSGIDQHKLAEFNDSMQNFQKFMAKIQLRLEVLQTKLFAESSGFTKMLDALERIFDATMNFLESPPIQWLFNTGIDIIAGFLDTIANILNGVSWLFGGSGSTTNNTDNSTTNKTTTNNIYIKGNSDATKRQLEALQSGGVLGG